MLSPFYSINRYDMIRQIRKDELHLLKDDPVRPHIELDWRTRPGKEVFVLDDNGEITAVVCVAYMDEVPASEHELRWPGVSIAVFYTVWSYRKGAGREIITRTQEEIKKNNPHVKRYVTLSPLTDMATRFHTRNGAKLIRKSHSAQNFEYN